MGDPQFVRALEEVRSWKLGVPKKVQFTLPCEGSDSEAEEGEEMPMEDLQDEDEWEIARRLMRARRRWRIHGVKMGPQITDEVPGDLADTLRKKLFAEFKDSSLSGVYPKNPPTRGPNGEAEIWLKPDARPVSIPPYPLKGERREALAKLVEECIDSGKMERGTSA